jgi:hypothetical protein
MVKRLCGSRVVLVAAALMIASGASADKPIKEPVPPSPVVFEGASAVCSFPVQVTYTAFKNFSITHLDKNGAIRWIGGAGRIVERITNLTNGKSVTLNASGPGKLTFNEDGSATLNGGGPWIVGYFAGDNPPLALILYRGHIVLNISPEGVLTLVSYVGAPPQDVCAMIA